MSQRPISSDDHVDMSHDREKSFPGARCHDDHDRAVAGYRASMRSMVGNGTNQRRSKQQGLSVSGLVPGLGQRQGYDFPGLKKAPSEYSRQNMYVMFIDEPNVVTHARDILGIGDVMWSSDYPHPMSSWPRSRAIAEEVTNGPLDVERELIL
jgi:hypothetical protein